MWHPSYFAFNITVTACGEGHPDPGCMKAFAALTENQGFWWIPSDVSLYSQV